MSTKTKFTVRLLTAGVLVAAALPGFASDRQDRREQLRRQAEYVNVDRYGGYQDSDGYGRYDDAYRPRSDRRWDS